jgi:hypothetical protein
MNPMMFPKMLVSHGEGWDWLIQRVHPSVAKMYFSYVVPMSLIPPAMLLYAWSAYVSGARPDFTLAQALLVAAIFFITELIVVPVMALVLQRIGAVIDAHPSYQDAFVFAAVVPTPLWLASITLFVPSVLLTALAMAAALLASAALIFQGVYRVYRIEDEGHALLVGGSVLAAGLIAWVAMVGLAFVSWAFILT